MTGFERVSPDVQAGYEQLAADTMESLASAGLAVFRIEEGPRAGAEVEIDLGDDDAGGVYVNWRATDRIALGAAQAVYEGRIESPVVRHSATIGATMAHALRLILESDGFDAVEADDDLRPSTVRVVSRTRVDER